ncbi:MAG: ABC transporter substrate-binding protein [Spirochaetota bacterium]
MSRTRSRFVFLLLAAALVFAAGQAVWAGGGQEAEEEVPTITFLTWNLPHYEDAIMGWIEDFEEETGAKAVWIDRKGDELPTYYQTQLAAGTAPDIVEIQSVLWYEYAAEEIFMPITSYLEEEPEVKERFTPAFFDAASLYQGEYYMLPTYTPSSLLFYNKPIFEENGLSGAPETLEELLEYTRTIHENGDAGFISLNFDWLYWPLFRAAGVEILNDDQTAAAFNTPAAVEVLEQLAELTESGAIPEVAWTGRWAEPNGAFGAGGIGMHHGHTPLLRSFMSQSDWATTETVGIDLFPGGWSVPNYHGFGITSTTEHPDLAWRFIEIATNDMWAETLVRTLGTLSGNAAADQAVLDDEEFREENPLLVEMFETQLSDELRLTGTTNVAEDAEIKEAVYSNLERALFGEISASRALDEAESAVNDILAD